MKLTSHKHTNFDELLSIFTDISIHDVAFSFKTPHDIHQLERIILSDLWPVAASSHLIVNTADDVQHRARSIVRSFMKLQNGVKFLDFGCGDGSVCEHASQIAKSTFGYDIKFSEKWANIPAVCTVDYEKICESSPFDIILLYDVIDHMTKDQANLALAKLKILCSDKTRIYVRCHPWTSITGGHVYKKLNRAYAHLFLSDNKLLKYQSEYVNPITNPVATYEDLWANNAYEVIDFKIHRTNLSPEIMNIIDDQDTLNFLSKSTKPIKGNRSKVLNLLSIEFIDYILKMK